MDQFQHLNNQNCGQIQEPLLPTLAFIVGHKWEGNIITKLIYSICTVLELYVVCIWILYIYYSGMLVTPWIKNQWLSYGY